MTSCSKDENGVLFFFIFGPEKDRFYVAAATTGAGVQSDCLQPRRMPSDACAQCGQLDQWDPVAGSPRCPAAMPLGPEYSEAWECASRTCATLLCTERSAAERSIHSGLTSDKCETNIAPPIKRLLLDALCRKFRNISLSSYTVLQKLN